MAVTYTWDVNTVNTYISYTDQQDPPNTRSDVIFNVHWVLKGVDGSYESTVYGAIDLDTTDLSSFTDFDSVTASEVQDWVESTMGSDKVTYFKGKVEENITEQKTPTRELRELGE